VRALFYVWSFINPDSAVNVTPPQRGVSLEVRRKRRFKVQGSRFKVSIPVPTLNIEL
jgi:hypothetical protein